MKNIISAIKKSPLAKPLIWLMVLGYTKSLPAIPSPEEKRKLILEYASKYNLKNLVETGTYEGDTVNAAKDFFDQIISIELDPALCAAAQVRFLNNRNVKILSGDSAQVLALVLKDLAGPSLFWLDGHWSGGKTAKGGKDTPIMEELKHILQTYQPPSVILIDDARCFLGKRDYPTVNEVKALIKKRRTDLAVKVKRDIIRIAPKSVTF